MIFPLNMPDPIRLGSEALARSGPNYSCTPTCFWARCIWPKPGQAVQIGSTCFWARCIWPKPGQAVQIGSGRPVLHNMIRAFFGTTEPNWMQEIGSGIYDPAQFLSARCRNQNASESDPACLLGISHVTFVYHMSKLLA